MVKNDISAAELAKLVGNNESIVIDFYATWCGPCKMFAPVFEKVAENNPDGVHFVRIDVDNAPELAQRYSVMNIPTVVGIKSGEIVHFSSGIMSEAAFQAVVDKLLR